MLGIYHWSPTFWQTTAIGAAIGTRALLPGPCCCCRPCRPERSLVGQLNRLPAVFLVGIAGFLLLRTSHPERLYTQAGGLLFGETIVFHTLHFVTCC